MPFILIWLKIKTNFIKLILNTFISIKGPIILQDCPILSPSEPDQLIQVISSLRVAPSVKDERVYVIATKSLLQERKWWTIMNEDFPPWKMICNSLERLQLI